MKDNNKNPGKEVTYAYEKIFSHSKEG